jgi:AmmeMemoRadiSam system protein B/AmmeMemoRadiSam system protein A
VSTRRRHVLAAALAVLGLGAGQGAVREPAVAGSFYPAEARALNAALDGFLADALPAAGPRPVALVAPHAGYIFSGQIAADAWAQAAGRPYDVIVLLGTNHTGVNARRVAVHDGAGLKTPLGVARADVSLVAALLSACPDCVADASAHAREHSIEVQLPFAQRLFPSVPVLAAVVPPGNAALAERFGRALASTLAGRQPLIVASSDLSHYPPARQAYDVDRRTVQALLSMDPAQLAAATEGSARLGVPELGTCACGDAPIVAAMVAAKALGAARAHAISYANSAELGIGEHDRVVGYAAVAFTQGPAGKDLSGLPAPPATPPAGPLTDADRGRLLALARNSISRFLASETLPLPRGFGAAAQRRQGAFVTLRTRGTLRGCIGQMHASMATPQLVQRMALAAAFQDPRFDKVTAGEAKDLEVEISLLTPFVRVKGAASVTPGRDGVVLEKDGRSAVFLPQVATEEGWGRDALLDNLCVKAGLPSNCWRAGATLSTFQAEVFGSMH